MSVTIFHFSDEVLSLMLLKNRIWSSLKNQVTKSFSADVRRVGVILDIDKRIYSVYIVMHLKIIGASSDLRAALFCRVEDSVSSFSF